ncbi:MAG: hypothetical protein V3V14_11780 [Saprospiraceae bacterium]
MYLGIIDFEDTEDDGYIFVDNPTQTDTPINPGPNYVFDTSVFEYFEVLFGFTNASDGDVLAISYDCFTDTYTVEIHIVDQTTGACEIIYEDRSRVICDEIPTEFEGGDTFGPNTQGGGGSTGSYSRNLKISYILNRLQNTFGYWGFLSNVGEFRDCHEQLEDIYEYLIINAHPEVSQNQKTAIIGMVACYVNSFNNPDGSCSSSFGLQVPIDFPYANVGEISANTLAWCLNYSWAWGIQVIPTENPYCSMISKDYSSSDINTVLGAYKIILENIPPPNINNGTDNDDPYNVYNVNANTGDVIKVIELLDKYPCLKPIDNIGFLIAEPAVTAWVSDYLKMHTCSEVTKEKINCLITNMRSFITEYSLDLEKAEIDAIFDATVSGGDVDCGEDNSFKNEATIVLLQKCISPYYLIFDQLGVTSNIDKLSYCYKDLPSLPIDPPNCEGCSVGESIIVKSDELKALSMLDCAIHKLNEFDGNEPSEVKDALEQNFGGTSSTLIAGYISFLFEHVRRHPYDRGYQADNGCSSTTIAWTFPTVQFTNVRLCRPKYWDSSELDRTETLIHEWMHLYYIAGDIAYDFSPNYSELNTLQQLLNADAFSEFVKEICDE